MECLPVQALTVTFGTERGGDELSRPFLCCCRSIIILLHLNVFGDTLIGNHVVGVAQRLVFELQSLIGALHDLVDRLFGDIFNGCFCCHTILLTDGGYLPEKQVALFLAEREDTSGGDAQAGVRDDLFNINLIYMADAFTAGTGTLWSVEREIMRSRFTV